MGYLDKAGLSRAFTKLKTLIDGKADVGHTHTKNQIGLGNVDNTADSTKSVKYATSAGSANTAASATKATSADSATRASTATSADSATRASTADRAIEIADYNMPNQGIKIGYSGDGFTSADFKYALGMNDERKIKDVSQAEYRKWLGLGSAAYTPSGAYASASHTHTKNQVGLGNVDNTADSTKSVKYANSAGTASKCNNVIYTHQNEINFSGGKQPTCYFNYRNADSDASDGGTTGITYKFCNYTSNTAYSTIEANNFVGKINGNTVSKSVPSNADFSNDKVAQIAVKNTDYADWRSLVWGASHSSTEGFAPTSVTDNLFSTNTLSVQPSTGTIKATTFKGNLSGKATSAGSADTATTANRVANTGDAIANAARHVWFSDSETETARVSSDNFKYNPSGNILTVNVSGNAATASRAVEIADYNNTNQGIKIGFAGDGFKSTDFQYALGMNNDRKIKDVSQGEYRKWLGLGSAAYTSSGAYAPSSHTHNYAGSSSAGGNANWANGSTYANYAFSNNGVSTSGSGSAYTATVSGFSLATGKSIVMIPHVTSTTTTPTLNVSGTGAKNIRMRLSSSTSSTIPLINSNFLTQYKPVKLTYDGTYWVIDDFIQPDANHLYGTLISRGSSAPSSGTAGFIYIQTT